MQGEGGFVRDYRSTIDWEWFTDVNTAHLWEYIRLRVNYEPSKFKGIEIKRGQMLESIATISKQTGLTYKQVRTALNHLKKTGEIECQRAIYGMLITVIKYDIFQVQSDAKGTQSGTQRAKGGHAKGTQRATYKEDKEDKEINKEKEINTVGTTPAPPTPEMVQEYADSIGYEIDAGYFCDYYGERGWIRKDGTPIADWKATIRNWQRKDQKEEKTKRDEINDGNSEESKPDYGFARTADWIEDALAKGD